GWERVAAGVGRCRLPVWDCTAGLVVGGDAALVVDAGSSLGEGGRVRTEAQRLAGRRVTHLALTHAHFDHVFGAAAFAGAEVFGAAGVDAVLGAGREALRADAVANGLDGRRAGEAVDA
ncbi:MBL fold metallo-hydrolase, partial [Streptomyces sp. TRM76130]|nr:MBL fold metallo-hydrolase [Streptomyces sp. TRM76130]